MKFIVILICIAINRYWMGPHPLRTDTWFEHAVRNDRIAGRISSMSAEIRLLCVVGIPVLLAVLLFWQMHDWIWGIVWMIGAVLVLAYSIGISNLDSAVTEHSLWLRKQQASATLEELRIKHKSALKDLINEEFSKVYPVLFWFMLLGPGGALLYRLCKEYAAINDRSDEDRSVTAAVIHGLEWLPVRITGLGFGVVGVFAHSTQRMVDSLTDWQTPAKELLFELAELGVAVSEAEPVDTQQFLRRAELHMKAVQELLHRVLLFWVALLAIVTVIGWG